LIKKHPKISFLIIDYSVIMNHYWKHVPNQLRLFGIIGILHQNMSFFGLVFLSNSQCENKTLRNPTEPYGTRPPNKRSYHTNRIHWTAIDRGNVETIDFLILENRRKNVLDHEKELDIKIEILGGRI